MEKKSLVKRIVCLSICLVLIVVACVIGYDFNAITVGEGSGTNAKVSSMNDMGAMLSAFSKPLSGFDLSVSESISDDDLATKYSSVTFEEESSLYNYLERQVGVNSSFSTQTMQRYMRVCITPSATYYHSSFTLYSDSKTEKVSDGKLVVKKPCADMSIDIEILVTKERVLLRINKARIAIDGKSLFMFERVIGQWGDFTEDTALGSKIISTVGATNGNNFKVLSLIGSYIGKNNDNSFSNNGEGEYSMKNDTFKEFAASLSSNLKDYSGRFDVDLSDVAEPCVSIKLLNDYEQIEDSKGTTVRTTYQFREYDSIKFSAINNTVIKGWENISVISAERFSELIVEEEQ